MKTVCLQIGHKNIEKLTKRGLRPWRDVNKLRKSTGASGERDYFSVLVSLVAEILSQTEKVDVKIVDSIYSENTTKKYDLWLSFHYDGGGTENRCMITSPMRNSGYLNEEAHNKADDFCEKWKQQYPPATGTINRDNRITAGMLEYYAFDYVHMDTPAVIVEHFNHTSLKGAELKRNPKLVAVTMANIILDYLGVDTLPSVHFTLRDDIPTEVEELYKLKEFERYNKYWTFGELIKDWTVLAQFTEDLQDALDELKVLNETQSIELDTVKKQLETQKGLATQLQTKKNKLEKRVNTLVKEQGEALTIGEVLNIIYTKVKDVPLEQIRKVTPKDNKS